MTTLLGTFIFFIIFSNPFIPKQFNSDAAVRNEDQSLSNIYWIIPKVTVAPTIIKSNRSETRENIDSNTEEKVKAYNIASEQTIKEVSVKAVERSNTLISCQDNPDICITQTPTVKPKPPIIPTIVPTTNSPTVTPTLIPSPTPIPVIDISPIPIIPCPSPCSPYEKPIRPNKLIECPEYIDLMPCAL